MNKIFLCGRLSKDIETRQGSTMVARTSIAVDRKFKKDGEPSADFFNLVAFGKTAEFLDKWFKKGMKILVVGRLENDSYTNKDGKKVSTTNVIVEECDFCESMGESSTKTEKTQNTANEGYVEVSKDDDLPFN